MLKKFHTSFLIPIVLFLIGIYSIYLINNVKLNFENRPLENCDLKNMQNISEYMHGFIKVKRCIEDHLVIKPHVIKLAHLIKKQYGKSQDPNLIIGKDGWSFLANANDITNQYRGINRYSNIELNTVVKNIDYFSSILKSNNIDFYIIIIPTQHVIYSEFLPSHISIVNTNRRIYQLLDKIQDKSNVLYLENCLMNNKKRGLLFNKVEGHWTELGALYGFECISEFLSFHDQNLNKININNYQTNSTLKDFPPVSYSQIVPTVSNNNVKWNAHSITENSDKTIYLQSLKNKFGDKTLINGDSFMEISHQFIADIFSNTHIISHQRQGLGLFSILKYKPNRVLFIASERFLQNIFFDISEIPPGQKFPQNNSIITGNHHHIDTLNFEKDYFQIGGWVHNSRGSQAYKITVITNNSPIFQSNPNRYRPDLMSEDNRLGFHFKIPITQKINKIDLFVEFFDGTTQLISAYK